MTEALKELIQQEAENNPYGYSWDFIQGRISGGLYWVEKMEGFAKWAATHYRKIEKDDEGNEWIENLLGRYYTTSKLLSIYLDEQLKKKEV